ncbi:MFS transporter [Streptomyces asiaticus]
MLVLPMYVALGAPSVALPAIGRALAVPFGATAWILAAWSLTSALAMPVAGRLLVRWSPFQVLVAGVVALAAGSALAGAGRTLPVVIVGRLIGGAGAGATVIAVFAAATALPGRQRIRALGIIAAASATASGCGTLLGGAVTAWLGWRAVLAIPVLALPLLLAALPSRRALTRSGSGERNGSTGRLDIVGAAVLSVLAGSLITLLQAHSVGLPAPVTLVLAAAGTLAAVGLWWRVRSTPDGFVPRRVIASRGFLAAGLIGGTVFAGYYGVLFRAPSLIEQATGGGPLEAGVLLVPAAACSVLAGRLVGTLTDRFTGWQVSAGLAALTVAIRAVGLPARHNPPVEAGGRAAVHRPALVRGAAAWWPLRRAGAAGVAGRAGARVLPPVPLTGPAALNPSRSSRGGFLAYLGHAMYRPGAGLSPVAAHRAQRSARPPRTSATAP